MKVSKTFSRRMSDTERVVYDTLQQMEHEREKAKRAPSVILLSELAQRVGCEKDAFCKAIDALCAAQMVKMGECINERYICALRGEK